MTTRLPEWLYTMLPSSIQLRHELRALRNYYKPQVAAAKAAEQQEEVEYLRQEWAIEANDLEEAWDLEQQAKLFRRARRWLVPIPKLTDSNSEQRATPPNARFLTDQARYELMREIRRAQRQWLQLIVPILGAVAGVIAAATGFVAVLLR